VNRLQIVMYFHCKLCLDERPPGTSPRDWAALEAGWTKKGLQIWCKRHEVNVIHIDFEGVKHIADTTRAKPTESRRRQ
jgi:hypothetical protein